MSETEKTNALRVKGAGELAALVPMDDAAFGKAYLDAMVAGHTEVLETIDNDLLKNANHEAVKKHLTATRDHVAMHLEAHAGGDQTRLLAPRLGANRTDNSFSP